MSVLHLSLPDQSPVVVAFPNDAHLHERAATVIRDAFVIDPTIDALIADAVIDGLSRRRPGWSPTTVLTDPTELSLIAVRSEDRETLGSGSLQERIYCAQRLHARGAVVGHVPAPLLTCARETFGREAHAALDSFAADHFDGATVSGASRPATFRLSANGPSPAITAVIPTAGAAGPDGSPFVDKAIHAVLAGSSTRSVIVVIGDEYVGEPEFADPRVSVVRRPPGPFNFSAAVNTGILQATTELVLLLNDDVSAHSTDAGGTAWCDQMAVHFRDPSVGVVGALLRYPDSSIQHAGIVLDDARPLHSFVGSAVEDLGCKYADVARDVVAVTGACMLIRRSDALAVGGFSTEFPLSFNDIDFCLKLRRMNRRVVFEPAASLTHHESASREAVTESREWDRYIGRWGHVRDPWYHPGHARPDDPHRLARNADHLDPDRVPFITQARSTAIVCQVHHSRIPDAG
ncbi:MAG: glycosyltransferase family 2 protein [Acidimicrobiaceae bacterium]|nr:glycosyltransferase family 2 protein [Acidimicrobiaceae bacterium]